MRLEAPGLFPRPTMPNVRWSWPEFSEWPRGGEASVGGDRFFELAARITLWHKVYVTVRRPTHGTENNSAKCP
jgi:hypothetical protein